MTIALYKLLIEMDITNRELIELLELLGKRSLRSVLLERLHLYRDEAIVDKLIEMGIDIYN